MKTTDVFNFAQLAEASYVLFDKLPDYSEGSLVEALKAERKGDFNGEFSSAQATEFVKHWSVTTHQQDTDSGYSSTLFQNKDDGRYVLAFRGTAGWQDLAVADGADIVTDGLALDQIVDLYNEWKRITSTGSYQAAKLVTLETETALLAAGGAVYRAYLATRTDIIIDYPSGTVKKIEFQDSSTLFSDERRTGLGLKDQIAQKGLTVTGHSLGGHLAAAFTRLFAEAGADAVTINGAGFATGWVPGLGGFAETNIRNLFGRLEGAAAFDASKIVNLYGERYPEFVTQNGTLGLFQQGGHEAVYIEHTEVTSGTTLGHGAGQMTNSLAVYDLLIRLDGGLQAKSPQEALLALKPLFYAASPDDGASVTEIETAPNRSLENLVDALGKLFKAGNPITAIDDRDALYTRIQAIKDSVAFQQASGMLHIESLVSTSRDTLVAQAQTALAYRYALKELNPFALTGDDALYAPHNANGELDLYDPTTGTGTLTDAYLQDRAAFLTWANQANTEDKTQLRGPNGPENWQFTDQAKNYTLNVAGQVLGFDSQNPYRKAIFDGDTAGWVEGGTEGDHLYGAGGDDIIQGNGGNDHLEGGLGLDELQGGAGNDTLLGGAGADYLTGGKDSDILQGGLGNDSYIFSSGDGWDWIDDADGQGTIKYDSTPLTGGKKVADNIWQSDDRQYTYSLYDRTENGQTFKVLSIQGPSGGMWVKHWQDGQLGITLEDTPATTPPAPAAVPGVVKKTSYYDQDHTVIDARGQGPLEITAVGDQGEVWGSGILKGNEFANYLHNGEGDDQLYGEGGRDVLIATTGNDRLYGGLGDDALSGGVDNDAYYNNTAQLLRRAA